MLKFLVIEDEPLVALDLRECLETEFNAHVTVVASIGGARRALESHYDFVFLDVTVEDGTTFELAIELREQGLPIAFTSGHNVSDIPAELLSVDFVHKPCCTRIIACVVRDLIETKEADLVTQPS